MPIPRPLIPRWSKPAQRAMGKLERGLAEQVREDVDRLARLGQGDVVKLKGQGDTLFRLRSGDYRVIFTVLGPEAVEGEGAAQLVGSLVEELIEEGCSPDDLEIAGVMHILSVAHRREAYRGRGRR